MNFVPLASIGETMRGGTEFAMAWVIGGNILTLAPFGFLLPFVAPRLATWRRMAPVALLFPCAIELSQLAISLQLGYSYRLSGGGRRDPQRRGDTSRLLCLCRGATSREHLPSIATSDACGPRRVVVLIVDGDWKLFAIVTGARPSSLAAVPPVAAAIVHVPTSL